MRGGARALLLPAATTLILVALLASLGFWQLGRLAEKEALLARIESRAHAPAQDPPERAQWAALKPEDYEFRRVRASGHYLAGPPALMFAHPPEGYGEEPGYVVATPFELASGGVVLVERGFVPASRARDPGSLAPPEGETQIVGPLRAPQSRNAFTPKDDPGRGLFYTRDPAAIAAWRGVADAAPFTLALEPSAASTAWPRPVPAAPRIANNHLSYALTWFSLAFAILVIFGLYARGALRGPSA